MTKEGLKAVIAEGMVTENTEGVMTKAVGSKVITSAKEEMNKKTGINRTKENI